MPKHNRRQMLSTAFAVLPGIGLLALGCQRKQEAATSRRNTDADSAAADPEPNKTESASDNTTMRVQYLEVVTPDVDAICAQYSAVHDIAFSAANPNLGGARVAKLAGGGMIGVRGPLRNTEKPVVRHYLLVDDIEASVAAAADAGAEIALPPMELPGHGICAIVIQGGIESGLWQL